MKKIKRPISLFLSIALLFCFASCNSQQESTLPQSIETFEPMETTTESKPQITADDITFYTIYNGWWWGENDYIDLSKWLEIDGYNPDGQYVYISDEIGESSEGGYSGNISCCTLKFVNASVKKEEYDRYIYRFDIIDKEDLALESYDTSLYNEEMDNEPWLRDIFDYTIADETSLNGTIWNSPVYLESVDVFDNLIVIEMDGYVECSGLYACTSLIDWSISPEVEIVGDIENGAELRVKYYMKSTDTY